MPTLGDFVDDDDFWEHETEEMFKVVFPFASESMKEAIEWEKEVTLSGIYVDWNLVNEKAVLWARDYYYELVRDITRSTRTYLREKVSEYIQSGQPLSNLVDELAGKYGDWRAQLIASTEVTRAYAYAQQLAWKESKVVEQKRWMTVNDELVCDICGPLDGTTVDLDDDFSDDFAVPPAHVQCRCYIQPIVKRPEVTAEGEEYVPPPIPLEETMEHVVGLTHDTIMDKMTKEEIDALENYQGFGYHKINGVLRGKKFDFEEVDYAKDQIKKIDKAFDRLDPLDKSVSVIRGTAHTPLYNQLQVGMPETNPRIAKMLANQGTTPIKVGDKIIDNGFVSTSVNSAVAEGFAASDPGSIILNITVPAGEKALPLAVLNPFEQEILLAHGQEFLIRKIAKEGDTFILDVVAHTIGRP